jgi:hypothetical protein
VARRGGGSQCVAGGVLRRGRRRRPAQAIEHRASSPRRWAYQGPLQNSYGEPDAKTSRNSLWIGQRP